MFSKLAILSAVATFVAAQAPSLDYAYLTSGASSSFCLSAPDGYTDNADVLAQIQTCQGISRQLWQFPSANGGASVLVQTMDQTKCLVVEGGVDADGTQVHLQACDASNSNQYWTYTSTSTLQWTGKGKCIEVTDGALQENRVVTIASCDTNAYQVWNAVTSTSG